MMQTCDKLTMIERRIMTIMADFGDFSRIFKAEILMEEWLEMGRCAPA